MGRRRKGRSLSPPLLGSDGQCVAGGGLPTPKRQRHRRPEVASGESSAAPASEKKKGNLRHYAVLYGTSREKRRDLRQEVKQHAVLHQAVSGDAASASSAREENLTQEEEAKAQSSLTSTNVTNTAHENSDQPDTLAHAISSGEIEGLHWRDAQLEEETQRLEKHITFSILPAIDIGRDDFWSLYEGQALKRLNERLALYRIKARKISEGALLEELVDAKLIEEYPPAILEDNGYFQGYERHFEWHFDTDYKYFECVGLQDYQRLALNKDFDYLDWDEYQTYNTYQGDQEFVEFYEKLSSKAKWMGFPEVDWQYERRRYQRLAIYQAVKIAAGYNNISLSLLYTGFSVMPLRHINSGCCKWLSYLTFLYLVMQDFLWSINHDTSIYKEIANFYFEMWKRIAKEKMSFVDALQQVYDQGICARCPFNMKLELAGDPGSSIMKINYDTYVAVISGEVQENEARLMIAEAAKKFVHKRKIYYDYARKKLDIARKIGVIPLQDDDEEVQDGEGSWHWN